MMVLQRNWFAVTVALAHAACLAADYDPRLDPTVNPPSLSLPAPPDTEQIAESDRLTRHLRADPATLNPALMSSAHEMAVKEMLFDEPVVYDAAQRWTLNSAMAAKFGWSDDHQSATLTLKPGLTWHDGEPVTADDVVFSWQVITDDRVPAVRARAGVDQIVRCKAVDPLTVEYTFREPLPTNQWSVKFPIIPRHVYGPIRADDPTLIQSDRCSQANRNPVGNGPYRFVEWSSGDRIVLDRWDGYTGSRPHYARIVFRIVPDNNVALMLFKQGRLDELALTPQQFAHQTADEAFTDIGVKGSAEQATMYCIGWNMDGSNPFFGDVRVRRAMSHALNVPLIAKNVYDNLYQPCLGIFPPQSWAHNPDVRPFKYDPTEAARLLDDAGWRIDSDDGWRYRSTKGPDGQPVRSKFELNLSFAQESKTSRDVCAIFHRDLRRLGIDVKLSEFEYTTLKGRVLSHDFQAAFWAWTAEPEPDDARHLFHSDARQAGQNFVGYANPDVDKLFEQARRTFDVQERQRCYQRIARIIYEEAPYTFIVNAPSLWAFHKRVHGVVFSPMGPTGFHPGVRAWWTPSEPRSPRPGS